MDKYSSNRQPYTLKSVNNTRKQQNLPRINNVPNLNNIYLTNLQTINLMRERIHPSIWALIIQKRYNILQIWQKICQFLNISLIPNADLLILSNIIASIIMEIEKISKIYLNSSSLLTLIWSFWDLICGFMIYCRFCAVEFYEKLCL